MQVRSWKTITALAAAAGLAIAIAIAAPPSLAATPEGSAKVSAGLSASDLSKLPLTNSHLTEREKNNLAVVLNAYRVAEANSLDVPAFINSFTHDGVFNDINGGQTYTGQALGNVLTTMVSIFPDTHRELNKITVSGDVVSIEVSIQGTFNGSLQTPAGTLKGNGAKVAVPTADFWYMYNGKVQKFNCFVGYNVMFTEMGVNLDWAGAVGNNS